MDATERVGFGTRRTRIERAPARPGEGTTLPPSWLRGILAVPLLGKLAGANALIVVSTIVVALATHAGDPSTRRMVVLLVGALVVAFAVNLALVYLALRPLKALEATADRVWRGDFAARVPRSAIADRDMARVGGTLNLLLDGLISDRARMRELAAQVISTADEERGRISRELHDSTAQSLAGLMLQLSAAARDSQDPELAARLAGIRELATDVLEEVRLLAHTMHPRILDDLGLPAALQTLAREAGKRHEAVEMDVTVDPRAAQLSRTVAAVLYRVAQEGVANALRHGAPAAVSIRVDADARLARLEVADDGRGFDVAEAERRRPGMGLFSMRDRVSLVNGDFEVVSGPGRGTRILATVPLEGATHS